MFGSRTPLSASLYGFFFQKSTVHHPHHMISRSRKMQHALLFVQQQTYCVVHQLDEPSAVVIICLKNEFLAVRFCI